MNSFLMTPRNSSKVFNFGRGASTITPPMLTPDKITLTGDPSTLPGERTTLTDEQDHYTGDRDKNPGEPLTHTVHRDALILKQNAFIAVINTIIQVCFSCNVHVLTHPLQQYALTDDRDKNTSDRDTYICQPDKNTDQRDNYPGERETQKQPPGNTPNDALTIIH